MTVEKMFFNEFVENYLSEKKMVQLTDIQKQVIPEMLQGKSVNVMAKTGSGKTLAYLLPIADLLKNVEDNFGIRTDKKDSGKPMAVILAPTRELCTQIAGVMKGVSHHAKLRVRTVLGGTGTKTKELNREIFEILIATPGRLASSLKRNEINLSEVRYLVMDEADQVLELGFKKDVESIFRACDDTLVKIGLFSATKSEALDKFVAEVFREIPIKKINHEDQNKIARSIRTFNIFIKDEEKVKMTKAFIKNESRGNGIIFVNKHDNIEGLINELKAEFPKIKFHALYGEMKANHRKKAYDQFLKEGGVLVATDIVARGMDIADLVWVLNYDLPFEAVYYVHRCGRVGRNMQDGFAYNLVTPKDAMIVSRINTAIANQTALKLNPVDEKRFKVNQRSKEKVTVDSKLLKKKEKLQAMKDKIAMKGKKKLATKTHVKTVTKVTKERYLRKSSKK